MRPPTDWTRLARAVDWYVRRGYSYVEVPWIVPPGPALATLPEDRRPFETLDGVLVGSAEQSLVHLALSGALLPGRHVAVSPCFRDDPEDEVHFRHFMKVELMVLHRSPLHEAGSYMHTRDVLDDARDFMSKESDRAPLLSATRAGVDLVLSGLEVGSYGYRSAGGVSWTYGTGLAEPRFSQALSRI